MVATAKRFLLRELTRQHHLQLDTEVGEFTSRQTYGRYVAAMASFRASVEPILRRPIYPASFGEWRPIFLESELRADLRDLGMPATPKTSEFPAPRDLSSLLGLLYVLEGSSLGARVLVRRAVALGFDADFGARHLALQISRPDSWTAFQQLLETAEPFDIALAAKAAGDTFQTACQAFKGARHVEFAG